MHRLAISGLLIAALEAGADPNAAVGAARERLAAGDCEQASRVLEPAAAEAMAIADSLERSAAAGAVHFYTALALSSCGRAEDARAALRTFFSFRPDLTTIDSSKYPRAFVDLFRQTQKSVQSVELFDRVYPGFDRYADVSIAEVPIELWGTHPGFQILANDPDKEEWGSLRTDEDRRSFIDNFWTRRDRAVIERRVAFADDVFFSPIELRGSLSDRGRVFVLLGPPARVYRSGLKRYETTIVHQRARTPLTGTLERWVYMNWQLPQGIAPKEVEFRFITQPGYGEGVMQKDFWALKALAEARNNPR
jgi:GWxTD domain-containing protein